jgi:hypothetical protein
LINCSLARSFRHGMLGLSRCARLATITSPRCKRLPQAQLVCFAAGDDLRRRQTNLLSSAGPASGDRLVRSAAPRGDSHWGWIQSGAPDSATSPAISRAFLPPQRARRNYEGARQRLSIDVFADAGVAVASE